MRLLGELVVASGQAQDRGPLAGAAQSVRRAADGTPATRTPIPHLQHHLQNHLMSDTH
jgi:hypothetical protein